MTHTKRPNRTQHVAISLVTLLVAAAMTAPARGGPREPTAPESACSVEVIRTLKARWSENPRNADIALKLGRCCLQMGYYSQAHSALSAALKVNSHLGNRVASLYLTSAKKALTAGEIRRSRIFFQKAIQADPHVRQRAAGEAFRQGKDLFHAGLPEAADARFSVANSLDDSYGKRICDIYFKEGNRQTGTACLDLYRIAAWYCRDHNEEIGLRLLEMAKDEPNRETVDLLKSEAARYVSAETVEAVFPSPSWKTVETRSYIGKGVGNGNDREYQLPTVQFGDPVLPGDKLIVETDGTFKIWDAGWEEHESRCEIIVQTIIEGEYFYVQGQKDRIIVVTVRRYY